MPTLLYGKLNKYRLKGKTLNKCDLTLPSPIVEPVLSAIFHSNCSQLIITDMPTKVNFSRPSSTFIVLKMVEQKLHISIHLKSSGKSKSFLKLLPKSYLSRSTPRMKLTYNSSSLHGLCEVSNYLRVSVEIPDPMLKIVDTFFSINTLYVN